MAYVFRTFGCPECGGEFEVMQERDEVPPTHCDICGADMTDDGVVIPLSLPRGGKITGSAIAKGVDITYRQLEESSAARAEEFGNPHMKVTDLKDNLRVGDVAAQRFPLRDPQFKHLIDQGLPVGFNSMGNVVGEGSQIAGSVPRNPETTVAGNILTGAARDRPPPRSNFNREQALKDAGRK